MNKIDDEDTWMNPRRSVVYKSPPPKNGHYFVIERKKRIPVSGNVAFIERWESWQEFDAKEKRDDELKRLRETTSWVLRGRSYYYVNGQQMSGDPFEMRDD